MVYLCATPHSGGSAVGRRGLDGVESWNWPSNSTINVLCFANCPEVELTLNGKSIGARKCSEAVNGIISWHVPYEPGTLEAVGRDNGRELCEFTLKTAGPPARIELLPDTPSLHADGKDICHVEFRILDANGVRVPDANPEVTFELSGMAALLGLGNGDLSDPETGKTNSHHAFQGHGLAILQSTMVPGSITLKATAPGLEPASVSLQSQ